MWATSSECTFFHTFPRPSCYQIITLRARKKKIELLIIKGTTKNSGWSSNRVSGLDNDIGLSRVLKIT